MSKLKLLPNLGSNRDIHLRKGEKIEVIFFDGTSYPASDRDELEKKFETVVPDLPVLSSLSLSNFPLRHMTWLRGKHISNLGLNNVLVSDISFVTRLPALKTLSLWQLPLTDLSAIKPFIENNKKVFNAMIYDGDNLVSGVVSDIVRQQNYRVRFETPKF
jgi:hypothetical protein